MLNATNIILALMLLFVAFVEGFLNPFWIWNAVPIAIGYVLLARARVRSFRPIPEFAYVVFGCGLVILAHLAWVFDWGDIATGSSTAGLIFIFLPFYAAILGGVAFGLAYLVGGRGHPE